MQPKQRTILPSSRFCFGWFFFQLLIQTWVPKMGTNLGSKNGYSFSLHTIKQYVFPKWVPNSGTQLGSRFWNPCRCKLLRFSKAFVCFCVVFFVGCVTKPSPRSGVLSAVVLLDILHERSPIADENKRPTSSIFYDARTGGDGKRVGGSVAPCPIPSDRFQLPNETAPKCLYGFVPQSK